MRNKPYKESPEELQNKIDKEVNDKFCKLCHMGNYRRYYELTEKYKKCDVCGHTIELKKK